MAMWKYLWIKHEFVINLSVNTSASKLELLNELITEISVLWFVEKIISAHFWFQLDA